jgi:hypothetical protein
MKGASFWDPISPVAVPAEDDIACMGPILRGSQQCRLYYLSRKIGKELGSIGMGFADVHASY